MSEVQTNNPLHGLTLEKIVVQLENYYGWEGLAEKININCFKKDPSVKSSLKFLRKTPWAREKVEQLYIKTFAKRNPWKKTPS
ncbi:MAG: DUF2132 domain-containing protein [Proteobacteria bacterium]|nr:DUF2132 domain-containing protein [Pseudomonadota bacterium]